MQEILKERLSKIEFEKLIKLSYNGKRRLSAILQKNKSSEFVQFEEILDNKAFHENIKLCEIEQKIEELLSVCPSNLNIICEGQTFDFKRTKKGTLLFRSEKNNRKQKPQGNEGILSPAIGVLNELGITDESGKIKSGMRAKFIQIERFTSIVAELLQKKDSVKIVDCGCGKAYLSFVLYHYLTRQLNKSIYIKGIDLKKDVIQKLKKTAEKYSYEGMSFVAGDIFDADFSGFDMLISLHACDKATDYALFNAIKNKVPLILAVPCCQHELNESFNSLSLKILNRYGIIKERLSALMTDALRASLLTYCGYKTKLIEFAELGHSPKNIMLMAVRGGVSEKARKEALTECEKLLNEIGSEQELYKLIINNNLEF